MPSVKKNFFWNSILTVSGYLFPLITYPYVSRVLGVTNIGICGFVDSLIQYFILFSTLGIATVGIREIAGANNDRKKLSSVYSSLIAFNFITTVIVAAVLLLLIYTVPVFIQYRKLFFIGIMKIVANSMLIEWFYTGIEDFKFITYRTLLVKILFVISVFVFIRTEEDYYLYFLILSLSVVFNAIINIIHARKFVFFDFLKIELGRYMKPILILGVYAIITSMYTTFNTSYLGFVCTEDEVGYYTTATKLHSILIAFYTAFTTVMMPRMSSFLSLGEKDKFFDATNKSIGLLFIVAIPLIAVFMIYSPDIINLFAGKGYEGAYTPARIIMPLIFIIGCNQVFIIQMLTPLKKEKIILRNSIFGALVGLCLNFLLVRQLGALGSAIVWLVSETVIFVTSFYGVRKDLSYRFPIRFFVRNLICYMPLILILIGSYVMINTSVLRLMMVFLLTVIYSFILQIYILKNDIVLQMMNTVRINIVRKIGREDI